MVSDWLEGGLVAFMSLPAGACMHAPKSKNQNFTESLEFFKNKLIFILNSEA